MRFTLEHIREVAYAGADGIAQRQIEMLQTLSSIDCGTRDVAGNQQVVDLIDSWLREIDGIQIEHRFFEGYGTHIVARLSPKRPSGKIILNAHLDTVFHPGDCAAHPFRVDGDVAYGLGIIDCKAGILVAISGVKIMQEAGLLPNKELVFIFNCDEEIGSPTGRQVYDEEIPGTEAVFVFEPARAEDGILTSRKGSMWIQIEVHGKKAHTGLNYSDGKSATTELAFKILRLYESNIDKRGIQFNVGFLSSGDGGVNVVSDYAMAKAGVRVANQADIDTVREILSNVEKATYIDGTTTTITSIVKTVPMVRTIENSRLYKFVRRAGEIVGKELPEQTAGGGSDASYFSFKGVPTVDAMGPYMYKIHSFDESMRISSLTERTRVFCAVLGLLDELNLK